MPALAAPLLKICGLTDPGQAKMVAALGVDAIGVIGVETSPRFVAAARRSEVFNAVAGSNPNCQRVLVVADPLTDAMITPDGQTGHSVLQLHGHESRQRCLELRRLLPPQLRIWKALRIRSQEDLARVRDYTDIVDAVLLDAWVPDQLGGTGQRLPLQWLRGFDPPCPWWLAGGVSPESVEEILASITPTGLDASSGVETAPGVKDLPRVTALRDAVQQRRRGGSITEH